MPTETTPLALLPPPTQEFFCVICHEPTTRLVDGEPSCDVHANLVYQDQMEAYIWANLP